MMFSKLVVVLLLSATVAAAQETRGDISGTVTDPQGGMIAGATVTVTNVDTNVKTEVKTGANGYYLAPLLITGNYQIVAEAAGFKRLVRSGLSLAARAAHGDQPDHGSGGRQRVGHGLRCGAAAGHRIHQGRTEHPAAGSGIDAGFCRHGDPADQVCCRSECLPNRSVREPGLCQQDFCRLWLRGRNRRERMDP